MSLRLAARDVPAATPFGAFLAWNEARWRRDRRYVIACDILALLDHYGLEIGRAVAIAHLAVAPVIRARWRGRMILSARRARAVAAPAAAPAADAAGRLVDALVASVAAADTPTHAALFRVFEELAAYVDLDALASWRPRHRAVPPRAAPRRILVIKLSALGDFVQALGPAAAIRAHHCGDHVTLLTTRAFAGFAERTGYFDRVMIDRRPKRLDIKGMLALRRDLRGGGFDRVYDLQTSDRSSLYALLWRPSPLPQWSGIALGCSHPHANLARDPQHTIDKQAEQLLMAGIWPVPLPVLPLPTRAEPSRRLPEALAGRRFALLVPGSSPHHPDKRWPADRYGALARHLAAQGLLPVVLGGKGEEDLAQTIRAACPPALDLVGRTDLDALADLARAAALTVGNDTGVTHIAAAGGHPVVVLFSNASDPRRCAPRGGVVRVLAVSDLGALAVETVFAETLLAMAVPEG